MATTRWYTYEQNKINGTFNGPARTVIVEAATPAEADARAETAGLEFMSDSFSCCGRRWDRMAEAVWEVGDVPTYNGQPVRLEPAPGAVAPSPQTPLADADRTLAMLISANGDTTLGALRPA